MPCIQGGFWRRPELSGRNGGAEGNRTPDLVIANDALSQLSYGPVSGITGRAGYLGAGLLILGRAGVKERAGAREG